MLPDDFLAMFRYVREKAYEGKSFRDYPQIAPELNVSSFEIGIGENVYSHL